MEKEIMEPIPHLEIYSEFKSKLSSMVNCVDFFSLITFLDDSEKQKLIAEGFSRVTEFERYSVGFIKDLKEGYLNEGPEICTRLINLCLQEIAIDERRFFFNPKELETQNKELLKKIRKPKKAKSKKSIEGKKPLTPDSLLKKVNSVLESLKVELWAVYNRINKSVHQLSENKREHEHLAPGDPNQKFSMAEIALIHIYNKNRLGSDDHAASIAAKYGFKARYSGKRLFKKYKLLLLEENRGATQLPQRTAATLKINIEKIIPSITSEEGKQTAAKDLRNISKFL